MKSKIGTLAIGVFLGLAAVFLGWKVLASPYTYQGSLIDPPVPAADFQLPDQNGNLFRLSEQKGEVVLIFFGYTHCPDVCPITMSVYRQVKNQLGDKAKDVRFVFITVDPERDTAEVLKQYMANFDPTFIGLTTDRSELEPVWKSYGVYQEQVDSASAGGYSVDHSATMYAIDTRGNWRLTYPFGIENSKITEDVLHLLMEK